MIGYLISAGVAGLFLLSGIRIIRPMQRGAVETLGKYTRMANPGFQWIVPVIQRLQRINVTERMAEIDPQEIITEDKLNAKVDLVIFYKVNKDEESIYKALYEVNNFQNQIVTLAQTTARNVIGGMLFKDVNAERNTLNKKLAEIMQEETKNWGVQIVRVELKEIIPPKDVQETMNQVIVAENEKRAAVDFATAAETKADGLRRSKIKEAEGEKQSTILKAEGQSKAFELINKSFIGGAKELRQYEVAENSLKNNAKIIITDKGINPQIILGNLPVDK